MTRLLLNAHEVACEGDSHRLWRVELPDGNRPRRSELERRYGVPLWLDRDAAWATDPIEGDDVTETEITCQVNPSVHAFVLREALLRRGQAAVYDTWIGFGHEINCAEPRQPLLEEGPVRVEPVMRMRIAHEGLNDELVLLVIRRSVRWRFADPLTADWLRPVANGEAAVRIAGDGPARARVAGLNGNHVTLELRRGEQRRVNAADYALVANPNLVYRALRDRPEDAEDVLRRVYQATGAIDSYRRVNRRAVRDRTEAAMAMLTEFGLELPLPDGGTAHIDDQGVEVIAEGDAPMEFR
jgi:hypothetical protein